MFDREQEVRPLRERVRRALSLSLSETPVPSHCRMAPGYDELMKGWGAVTATDALAWPTGRIVLAMVTLPSTICCSWPSPRVIAHDEKPLLIYP